MLPISYSNVGRNVVIFFTFSDVKSYHVLCLMTLKVRSKVVFKVIMFCGLGR